jgi:hypothetical protein
VRLLAWFSPIAPMRGFTGVVARPAAPQVSHLSTGVTSDVPRPRSCDTSRLTEPAAACNCVEAALPDPERSGLRPKTSVKLVSFRNLDDEPIGAVAPMELCVCVWLKTVLVHCAWAAARKKDS